MVDYQPIGSCCARPKFNATSEVDDCALPGEPYGNSLITGARKFDRATAFSVAGILVALVAFALIHH
jgi:hypothetical protein